MVEYLAGLVMQFVLPDLSRRGALGEHFHRFELNAGDSGIERSLPELLYRGRASNGFAAGGHHLTICGVQPRKRGTITLGGSRRERGIGGLD
jgi:hypothetical protein